MNFLQQNAEPIHTVIAALLSLIFAWLANEIRVKVRSTRVQGILLRLTDLAETVTDELDQTVVDAVKVPGQKLDENFAASVKQQAIEKVKAHLGPKGVTEVLNVFGYTSVQQVESLIASKIESSLRPAEEPKT